MCRDNRGKVYTACPIEAWTSLQCESKLLAMAALLCFALGRDLQEPQQLLEDQVPYQCYTYTLRIPIASNAHE